MQYPLLGNNPLKLSKIALGTWQFGGGRGWGDFDIKEGEKIIEYCLQKGVNFIDTAEAYGDSEKILGKLLKGKREKFFIATKLTTKIEGNRFDYKTVKAHLETSLIKLQTDYVDLYQIHWPKMKHLWHRQDMEKQDYENIFDSMTKLQKEGLIRFVGVSNFRIEHLKEFSKDALNLISINQIPYSILWRCYDIDHTIEFCKKNKIGILAYSPLAEGLLTGRFEKNTEIQEGVRKANILFNEPIYSKALEVVEEIKKIANEIDATSSQVALKWVTEKDYIFSTLVGARKSEHFAENIEAININLTEEQIEHIDKISLEFQNKYLLPKLELWIFNCLQEDLDKLGIKRNF
ncbi:MAG: aldo/keto reductase [Candidatus Ratteibacteria bacterium]|nr:aldo/keto reductase [Candidatus Ratteibacteria bacterium]